MLTVFDEEFFAGQAFAEMPLGINPDWDVFRGGHELIRVDMDAIRRRRKRTPASKMQRCFGLGGSPEPRRIRKVRGRSELCEL